MNGVGVTCRSVLAQLALWVWYLFKLCVAGEFLHVGSQVVPGNGILRAQLCKANVPRMYKPCGSSQARLYLEICERIQASQNSSCSGYRGTVYHLIDLKQVPGWLQGILATIPQGACV